MTIVRPTGSVGTGAGSRPLDLPQAGVHRVRVDLSVGPAHDRIQLHLWKGSKLADAEPGSDLSVALGDAGSDTDVLAAEVAGVVETASGLTLTAYAPSRRLSSTFVARAYLRQTLADVVNDLLSAGEVTAGSVEAPRQLPALHVDGRRSVWSHLHRLAALVGAQVTTGADGSVSFAPPPGSSSGGPQAPPGGGFGGGDGLREGANVLAWRAGPRRSNPEPVPAVVALGAASSLGSDKWYHVQAQPDDGSALVTVAAVARDRDLAEAATTARADAARRRRVTGRFRVPGDPAIRAGGTLTADDVDYRVLEVRHLVVPERGYVCDVVVEGT